LRIGDGERLPAAFVVVDLGDKRQGIVLATQFVAGGADAVDEVGQPGVAFGRQLPAPCGVEQTFGLSLQGGRKRAAQAQPYPSLAGIVQKDLAECTREAGRQGFLATKPTAQLAECEFDVLAGTQVVGLKVRARAVIVACVRAPNHHPVAAPAIRVVDGKLGENWVLAGVLKTEMLFAAELAAQRTLPVVDRKAGWLALTGESSVAARARLLAVLANFL